ncbi:hypothetical protein KIY82_gp13 [Mycobacterium phage Centaur]|uniref:Uncharacterized protein n=1 Tax=Mycobacterium phage Centaur TaxID=2488784 RepID=A0A3G8FF97_9CAUD|nr:hypothetical protein KIY82_gp13 [Mycobacterium phage Centaur]AOZ64037.1 hypothetical protein SEA_BAEHEXIC_93 [Mycobacterium phage Baehexic]AZF93478.1 hypothetical protein SEA_CENTAUR_94 [Mycobacterium phage Centaur]
MPAQNYRRVEDVVDDEGWILTPGYSAWDCTARAYGGECGGEVRRYRGSSDVSCDKCGAWYNASGQRLRDDFMNNRSMYDDEVGDLEGFEMQHAGDW